MPTLSLVLSLLNLSPGLLSLVPSLWQTRRHSSHLRLGGTTLPLSAACSTSVKLHGGVSCDSPAPRSSQHLLWFSPRQLQQHSEQAGPHMQGSWCVKLLGKTACCNQGCDHSQLPRPWYPPCAALEANIFFFVSLMPIFTLRPSSRQEVNMPTSSTAHDGQVSAHSRTPLCLQQPAQVHSNADSSMCSPPSAKQQPSINAWICSQLVGAPCTKEISMSSAAHRATYDLRPGSVTSLARSTKSWVVLGRQPCQVKHSTWTGAT